jgi:secondary thiamine-phosphate synthase enzyme
MLSRAPRGRIPGRAQEDTGMPTLAPTSTRHLRVNISTECPTQFVDLTMRIVALVRDSGVQAGFVNIQSLHTTTAIVLNEHEPLLLDDFAGVFNRFAPADRDYRHDHPSLRTVNLTDDERINGHSHCRALLLPSNVCLNIVDGQLQLGRWQRLFLVELDGPRERQVSVLMLGEGTR